MLPTLVAKKFEQVRNHAQAQDPYFHYAEIITIEGESYRRRVAEAKQKSARTASSS